MTAIGITATELTDLVVDVYREALANPSLDSESDFFEAGGDSLAAFQITARLQATLGVDVPVALVFAYPSPADLASVVEQELEVG
ncbi:acyl carrier protein [Saccharothrix sp. HUAS TT1]|uniref:acyl carrier protein n=1 Tax=unclassified Saccharothrix TaxID=2593673 RepID=UPI00345C0903